VVKAAGWEAVEKGLIPACGMLKLKEGICPVVKDGVVVVGGTKGCTDGGAGAVEGGEVTDGACCENDVGLAPNKGGTALGPKAEVVWEPKGDLTSVEAVVPNKGGFAVCCPKSGFGSAGAIVVPNAKGDFDSVGAGGFTLACCPKRGLDSVVAAFVPNLLVTAPNDAKAVVSARFGVPGLSFFT